MIFNPYFIVHYLSQFLVLEPGDLINTGTPPGVGMGIEAAGLAAAGRRHGAGHRRPRARQRQTVDRAPVTMSAFVVTGPRPVDGAGGRPPPAPGRARSSSTSTGSASAAPTSSSSPARWRTCTRATPRIRCGSATSGAARSSAVGAGRRPGVARAGGSRATRCSAAGSCRRCLAGRQHVCARPVRDRHPRRLSGRARRAARASRLRRCTRCPDAVDDTAGAMVEPGGNALRAVRARGLRAGDRVLVLGPGTIGLLAAQFAPAHGRRGPPAGLHRAIAGVRPHARLRGRLAAGRPARAALGRGDRRVQRARRSPRSRSTWSSRAGGSSTSASPARPASSTPARSPSRT